MSSNKNNNSVELPSNIFYWMQLSQFQWRSECRNNTRPCHRLTCEYNLYLQPTDQHLHTWAMINQALPDHSQSCLLDLMYQGKEEPEDIKLNSKTLPHQHSSICIKFVPPNL
jgi:hypothetical protein